MLLFSIVGYPNSVISEVTLPLGSVFLHVNWPHAFTANLDSASYKHFQLVVVSLVGYFHYVIVLQ